MKLEEYTRIKGKIRSFLLNHSSLYQQAKKVRPSGVGMLKVARDLEPNCNVGVRRLQKYLSKTINQKDLAISLDDVMGFAKLADLTVHEFCAYLFQEVEKDLGQTPVEKDIHTLLPGLTERQRLLLALNLRKCETEKAAAMARLLVDLMKLSPDQFSTISTITRSFQIKNDGTDVKEAQPAIEIA